MNATSSKLDKSLCQKSILSLKDASKDEIKGNESKITKKQVTFNRFVDYHIYTENLQMEEMPCFYPNDDDWVASALH